jgi:hypothetical protein
MSSSSDVASPDGGSWYGSSDDSGDDGHAMAAPLPPWAPCGRARSAFLLASWLKLHFPRDVLMPVVRGEKKPRYGHAGGAWTWARYDFSAPDSGGEPRSRQAFMRDDLGLLLHDLCVIDADTQADADALEARFPELAAAPMASTARGRHYYFARSPLADAHGFYDGAAQVVPTVDFKTRAGGGGSGFVVVAPSANKARRGAACAKPNPTQPPRPLNPHRCSKLLPLRAGVGARAVDRLPRWRAAGHFGRAAGRRGGAAPRAAAARAALPARRKPRCRARALHKQPPPGAVRVSEGHGGCRGHVQQHGSAVH